MQCSGGRSEHADRAAGPRGARDRRLGRIALANRAERAFAVYIGDHRGLRVHHDRARRLGRARLIPRTQGTHMLTRPQRSDSFNGNLHNERREAFVKVSLELLTKASREASGSRD